MFASRLRNSANTTKTEKGAKTLISTQSAVLDLFSLGGTLRTRPESEVENLIGLALKEDLALGLKALFYLRDIRSGQGERRTFHIGMKLLEQSNTDILNDNIENIPFFGSYKDLLVLINPKSPKLTKTEKVVMDLIKVQLEADMSSEKPSLLAKWLPSENTKTDNKNPVVAKENRAKARKIRMSLGLTPREFRKILSNLRTRLGVVEKLMCDKHISVINYEHVPSRCMFKLRKAFAKRDETRFKEFLRQVKNGEKTIKVSTLFPYDIVRAVFAGKFDDVLDAQWKALPNFMLEPTNMLVLADLSGSMGEPYGSGLKPIDSAVALSIYVAERNVGAFHNLFMPFSGTSKAVEIRGLTIKDKVESIFRDTRWHGSTNLQAAFDEILRIATINRCAQSELPSTLIIISDMEFDQSCTSNSKTNLETAQEKFKQAGYKLPEVVFWNVCSRNNQSPADKNERGVFLVSGHSPSIMKQVLTKKAVTPYELMLETLNSDRYARVKVPETISTGFGAMLTPPPNGTDRHTIRREAKDWH